MAYAVATLTEPYLVKSFVSKGSETEHLNITNHIPFKAELYVDCSKAIQNTINAIPALLKTSFTVCQNTTVCSSRRQPQNRMESFVSKGSETRHLNITNHLPFDAELPVDCSKLIWFTINAIPFPPQTGLPASRAYTKYHSLLKQTSAAIPYGKFCVKRLWDQAP